MKSETETLEVIRKDLGDCTRCRLHETRTNIVFGSGNPNADWMFIGEGPGANEDAQGEPFVGKAGILLTKLIEESGWSRKDVYILNVVKCRPPGNRDPAHDEVQACRPFLLRQIHSVSPKVITTLGRTASNLLLGTTDLMGSMRGKEVEYDKFSVIPTYHPSYIQRGNWDRLDTMRLDFELAIAILNLNGVFSPTMNSAKTKT